MGTSFFIYNIILIILNTLVCVSFLSLYFKEANKLYLWVGILFAIYVADVVILYMADYEPIFSEQFLYLYTTSSYYYLIILAMTFAFRMITRYMLDYPLSRVEIGVWIGVCAAFLPIAAGSESTVWHTIAIILLLAPRGFILWEAFTCLKKQRDTWNKWTYRLAQCLYILYIMFTVLDFTFNFTLASVGVDTQIPVYREITVEISNFIYIGICFAYLLHISRKSTQENDDRLLDAAAQSYTLTGREREILGFLYRGYSNRQISEEAYISIGTVKTHTHNIYQKLGIQNRSEIEGAVRQGKPPLR